MGYNEAIAKAQQLNAKAEELNKERLRKLGEKEAAEKALSDKLEAYNQQYGCNYTVADLSDVYRALTQKLNSDIAVLENQIDKVESGAYVEVKEEAQNLGINESTLLVEEAKLSNPGINIDAINIQGEEVGEGDAIIEAVVEEEDTQFNFAELAKKTQGQTEPVKFEL